MIIGGPSGSGNAKKTEKSKKKDDPSKLKKLDKWKKCKSHGKETGVCKGHGNGPVFKGPGKGLGKSGSLLRSVLDGIGKAKPGEPQDLERPNVPHRPESEISPPVHRNEGPR